MDVDSISETAWSSDWIGASAKNLTERMVAATR